ncbi:hypothetical protein [Pantoea sp. 18069]|uniref:hypothetical protein n=1 Tax=Pantoea sp. 18069 TaxID=2681415 RepID=UPI001358910B|nr:hypothetical protein [Pantoea sp. 18069]
MGPLSVDLSSITLISQADLDAMDLGTAIQLVQGQRAALLEDQLKDQLKEIQNRNLKISELNATLSSARELTSQFGEKDGTGKKITDLINDQRGNIKKTDEWKTENEAHKKKQVENNAAGVSAQDAIIQTAEGNLRKIKESTEKAFGKSLSDADFVSIINIAGLITKKQPYEDFAKEFIAENKTLSKAKEDKTNFQKAKIENLEIPDSQTKAGNMLENLKNSARQANMEVDINNKGDLNTLVENIKSLIDSLSNSQQMDMLRLQNYSNKYNETFETRTNMIKKEHDLNTQISNNTR